MRKTIRVDREEYETLKRFRKAVDAELADLQNRNHRQAGMLTDLSLELSAYKKKVEKQDEVIAHAFKFKRALHVLWYPGDALIDKVSLRSRWPALYNVLDKELK